MRLASSSDTVIVQAESGLRTQPISMGHDSNALGSGENYVVFGYPKDVIAGTSFFVSPSPMAQPGYLQSATDPNFGTAVERITDKNMPVPPSGYSLSSANIIRHQYAERAAWNSDASKYAVGFAVASSGYDISNPPGTLDELIDGHTYTNCQTFCATQPSNVAAGLYWSNTVPNRAYQMYYGIGEFQTVDVVANTRTHYPTGYAYADWIRGHGDISNDDRYVPLAGANYDWYGTPVTPGSTEDLFLFDTTTDTVAARMTGVPQTNESALAGVLGFKISPSGKYVNMDFGGSASPPGYTSTSPSSEWIFQVDYANKTFINGVQISQGLSHEDWGTDDYGNDMLLGFDGPGNYGGANYYQIWGFTPATNRIIDLTPGVTQVTGGHISCRNVQRPGWCYISSDDNSLQNRSGENQAFAIKLDGSGTIEQYAYEYYNANYVLCPYPFAVDSAPEAVPNPDGTKLAFASNWNQPYSSNTDCPNDIVYDYVASQPTPPPPANGQAPTGYGQDTIAIPAITAGAGAYSVFVRMMGSGSGSTIYAQVNGNSAQSLSTTTPNQWQWAKVGTGPYSLQANGTDTVTINGYQPNVKVDAVLVSESCIPTGDGSACLAPPSPAPTPTATPTPTPTPTPAPTATATPSPTPVSNNLLQNPGFETGTTAYWNPYGGATVVAGHAHSGTYSAQVGNTTGESGIEQPVSVTPGVAYTVSGWGEVGASGDTGYIGMKFKDSSGNVISATDQSVPFTSTTYTQVSESEVAPSNATTVVAYVWKATGSSNYVYGDDMALTTGASPSPTPTPTPTPTAAPTPTPTPTPTPCIRWTGNHCHH